MVVTWMFALAGKIMMAVLYCCSIQVDSRRDGEVLVRKALRAGFTLVRSLLLNLSSQAATKNAVLPIRFTVAAEAQRDRVSTYPMVPVRVVVLVWVDISFMSL